MTGKKKNLYVLGIIPARGGSKGIPYKNIVELRGKPMIYYTIREARKSEYLDRIVVSTDNGKIREVAENYQVEIIPRPERLARDNTPSLPVFKHAIDYLDEKNGYVPDLVVILQPTSPLRKTEDIDDSVEKLLEEGCDSVITVMEVKHPPHWMVTLDEEGRVSEFLDKGGGKVYRRQDTPDLYIPNGAVFVTRKDVILDGDTVRGPDTRALVMPPERSIDIDTELDLLFAEKIMEEKKA